MRGGLPPPSAGIKIMYFQLIPIWLLTFCPVISQFGYAQDFSPEQTEASLKNYFGLDKLKALNSLTKHYHQQRSRKALRYGRQAVTIGENIFVPSNTNVDPEEHHHLVQAYFQLGEALHERGNYFEGQKNLLAAKALSNRINHLVYLSETETYLEDIQALIDAGEIKENFFSKTFGDINVGEAIGEASKEISIQTEITIARSNEKKGDFEVAIDHYKKAVDLLRDKGEAEKISELQLQIAVLLDSMNQHVEAQEFLTEAIMEIEASMDSTAPSVVMDSVPDLLDIEKLEERSFEATRRTEQKSLKDLADNYAREKDFEKSLTYYKLYQELTERMEADSLKASVVSNQREREILLLRQQKQISDLNVEVIQKEKEKQIRLRNTFILIGLLILASSLVTLFFYVSKRREHKKLAIAYRDLDKTKGKLVGAEQRIVKLLRQQVSGDVAKELLMNSSDKLGERRFVCIMFLDIRDFTAMAEKLSPEELIGYQNKVFGFMIDIVQNYNGNINQLLGDGFMATFGAPVSRGNDCQNAFLAAKEILHEVKERSEAGVIQKTKIGIGLHAGYVVTGNVGNEARRQYSVTG
ncbi:MAG: hypothetical protein OEQ53_14690, partial [Saprospiraceae bacterium]|nr:hypothetical protein [Saprospiraceae bacterium]